MTRQEPLARGRKCNRWPWKSTGSTAPLRAPPAASQPTSSKKASQSSSQGRKPASSRRPASQPVSSKSGAKVRNEPIFSAKKRKLTSHGTSPRWKPSVPRAGAHCNGLRDVKEARTSPLLPPESRRLDALFSDFLRKILVYFAENFGMYPTYSARNTDFFFAENFCLCFRHVFEAFRSSNAAKSPFRDKK